MTAVEIGELEQAIQEAKEKVLKAGQAYRKAEEIGATQRYSKLKVDLDQAIRGQRMLEEKLAKVYAELEAERGNPTEPPRGN